MSQTDGIRDSGDNCPKVNLCVVEFTRNITIFLTFFPHSLQFSVDMLYFIVWNRENSTIIALMLIQLSPDSRMGIGAYFFGGNHD